MRAKPWLKKQTGVWYVQIGNKQHSLGRDKAKAQTLANKLVREAATARGEVPPGGYSFAELLDLYSANLQRTKAPSTYEAKKYFIEALKASPLGKRAAEAIKPIHITEFLAAQPRIKSPTTTHTRITFLIGVYNWGLAVGAVTRNPLARMPKPSPVVRQGFLPESRFQEFLNAAGDGHFRELVHVTLESGMRAQEIFKTTAANFDGEKLTYLIADSKGKQRSRVVFLPGDLKERLARLCAEHPTGPIFCHSRGKPWTKDSVSKRMRAIAKTMKVPGLCLTMLRHSFCHWRLTNGQSALVVAKLMGHTSTRMVETRYGHLEGSDFLAQKAAELTMPVERKAADADDSQGPAV